MGLPFKLSHLLIKLKHFCCLWFQQRQLYIWQDKHLFMRDGNVHHNNQQTSTEWERETEERDRGDREREIANVCCRARESARLLTDWALTVPPPPGESVFTCATQELQPTPTESELSGFLNLTNGFNFTKQPFPNGNLLVFSYSGCRADCWAVQRTYRQNTRTGLNSIRETVLIKSTASIRAWTCDTPHNTGSKSTL